MKTLLIVRLDAIGDYILFRNFLEEIRYSEVYKNYHITLCGNELWRSIAEAFDKDFVDEFIWLNKEKFIHDRVYRKKMLTQIADAGYETAICPNAAREFLTGDSIIKASGAKFRIGACSTKTIDPWIIGKIGNLSYTRLINTRKPYFEFDKNRLFFELLLNKSIHLNMPYFNVDHKTEHTIIMMPGAGELKRQWDIGKFAEVAEGLIGRYNYEILIAGSHADTHLAKEIIQLANSHPNIKDMTGKTSLAGLVHLMANAQLVIAHDSGGLHMAAATRTPVIGLMTGKHYMRFGPYPGHPNHIRLFFPMEESYYSQLFKKFGPGYFEDVITDINLIRAADVIAESVKLIGNGNTAHR